MLPAAHLNLGGVLGFFATNGIWAAAILMSAGFFLSAIGKNVTAPNRFIIVLYLGVVSLGAGVISLSLGLLAA